MRHPGHRIVSVLRRGPRNRDGDAIYTLVATHTGVSVQMTGTGENGREEGLDGRAERAITSWTLVFPPGTDVRAADRLTVHEYNADRELKLAVDGHPHEPQFRSGRRTNLIVRAREVDTV